MKIKLQTLILSLCFIASAFVINAQKYGYINSTLLLSEMPEVAEADSKLEAYQSQLVSKGEQMVKDLEVKFQTFSQQADSGALSQIEIQQKQGELQLDQEKIGQYEQEVQQKIYTKREELYKPILEKVKNVLDAFAKNNNYTMIFDSSGGGILHAVETDDLMPLIKKELGI